MLISNATRLFPVWAILCSVFAYYQPSLLASWKSAIVPLLIIIMFSMGMTLTFNQFKEVLRRPRVLGLGVLLQYSVMPLAAFIIAKIMNLPLAYTIGMVLVGSSPGGTASTTPSGGSPSVATATSRPPNRATPTSSIPSRSRGGCIGSMSPQASRC